ncbi:hypothetical protein [Lentibacillus salicampi]|uniref:Uncharacterized protein n=1 Tax=Lentibacillus salicampi TaxID=175306 RepID=A0A4Y9A7L1_9BACI|nr:hypothetical protein [Lentibacillus salicampi]TFJ91713.1 hypothetical protein E4U82_16080 [Lentibacillus salicampi]
MVKLITVERAKKEVQRLQHFIDLAESYESDTLNKWTIKEYAYTNSIKKVVEKANTESLTVKGEPLSREYAVAVINGKANDELHRILRRGYRLKIKPNKRKY